MAGEAVNTGKSPSHMVSAINPLEIEAVGRGVMFKTVAAEIVVQLAPSVTSTVIWSKLVNAVELMVLEGLGAPRLEPLLKNSYNTPPEALNVMVSPIHPVFVPVSVATGAGLTVMESALLKSSQATPLSVEITTLLKSMFVV